MLFIYAMYSKLVTWMLLIKKLVFIACLLCARYNLKSLINVSNPWNDFTKQLYFTDENTEALKGCLPNNTQIEDGRSKIWN